ncbi:MAG TPA: dienelactone hydrolase family protein [Acidimicrobiia bacterium]
MNLGRRALGAVLVLTAIAAGCGHSAQSTGSATGSTTSSSPSTVAPNHAVYASIGNFTVGVTTMRLPSGTKVEVWYPANGGVGFGSDTYDVRSFLPAAVAGRLDPKVHAYVSTDANRDVVVGAAGERFPLVVFSHGDAGFRDESTFLTARLASWGMVVAAPDHPSRDLAAALSHSVGPIPTDVADILGTIDLVRRQNARAGGPFRDRIDLSKVAVVGYGAGGRAAMKAAADPRVAGYVALASDRRDPAAAGAAIKLPAKPSLFVAGAADRVVSPTETTAAYRAAPAPSYEWVIDGAGHNAFDDLCVVANQQGLVAFADRAGIGSLVPTSLAAVLTDGCRAPDLAVLKTWPIIDQVVTGFLRHVIGPDRVAVGLEPAGTRTIAGVKVTVSARTR